MRAGLLPLSLSAPLLLLLACGPPSPGADAGADASPGDGGFPLDVGPLPEALPPCEVTVPEALLRRPGPQGDGSFLTLDGRLAVAAGPSAVLRGFPADVAAHPSLRVAYAISAATHVRVLFVVDMDTREILQEIERGESLYGMELSPDGARLYLSGGASGEILAFDVGPDGRLSEAGAVAAGGYLAGMALSPDGATLWTGAFDGREVIEVDTASLAVSARIPISGHAFDLLHLPRRSELYVSDLRGEGISVVDVARRVEAEVIPLPVSPAGMARRADGATVWAAVSGSDAVVAIDPSTRALVGSVLVAEPDLLREDGDPLPHSNVNALWYDDGSDRLYVSQGADNAIGVFEGSSLRRLGALPSDRYPTDVELASDGRTLVIASGKGGGAGPNSMGEGGAKEILKGTIAFVDVSSLDSPEALAEATSRAALGYRRALDAFVPDCEAFPIPIRPEQESPIQWVILIVKENKTYDSILGDLGMAGADGDPSLAEWGLPFTPNHHALAETFAHSDNFYVLSPNSDSGHVLLTSTHMTEFAERMWIEDVRHDVEASFPLDPLASPLRGNFFTHLIDHGVDLRIYGEIVGTARRAADGRPVSRFSDLSYPGGPVTNYAVPDEEKAAYVIEQIRRGRLARFTYVLLPNDHGAGARPDTQTPESMVADNDYAMGLLIEALSRSPYWPRAAVFVVEDDPQGTVDHVEAHRSILHVASPWARRGYVSHAHASYLSVFATIERILGVPPLGRPDAAAAPLYDLFTTTPDFTPYEVRPREVPFERNPPDGMGAEMSMAMDLRSPDREPHLDDLTRIVRAYRHGGIDRAEAERRLAELRALMEREEEAAEEARGEDEDGEVEESAEEARAFDAEYRIFRAWARRERGVSLPTLEALPLGPIRRID